MEAVIFANKHHHLDQNLIKYPAPESVMRYKANPHKYPNYRYLYPAANNRGSSFKMPLTDVTQNVTVTSYIMDGKVGIVISEKEEQGFFHEDAVCLCNSHGLSCSSPLSCQYGAALNQYVSGQLSCVLPVGTKLTVLYRSLESLTTTCPFKFQISLAWPKTSLKVKPTKIMPKLSEVVLGSQIMQVLGLIRGGTTATKKGNGITDKNVTEQQDNPRSNGEAMTKDTEESFSDYVGILEHMSKFFQGYFPGIDSVSLRQLSYNIASVFTDDGGTLEEIKAIVKIHSFVKENGIDFSRDEYVAFIANFKMLANKLGPKISELNKTQSKANAALYTALQNASTLDEPVDPIPTSTRSRNGTSSSNGNASDQLSSLTSESFNHISIEPSQTQDLSTTSKMTSGASEESEVPDNWAELLNSDDDQEENDDHAKENGAFNNNTFYDPNFIHKKVLNIQVKPQDAVKFEHLDLLLKNLKDDWKDFLHVQDPSLLPKLLVSTWVGCNYSMEKLKSDLSWSWSRPKRILENWVNLVEKEWQARDEDYALFVSAIDIAKTTFKLLWHALMSMYNITRNEATDKMLNILIKVPFLSNLGNLYNVNGIVTHFMSSGKVGLIQTPTDKVLFESNVTLNKLNVGSFVKLNAVRHKMKEGSHFYFATRVWIEKEEDWSSVAVPGSIKYWKSTLNTLTNLVQNNPEALAQSTSSDADAYEAAFDMALRKRGHFNNNNNSNSIRKHDMKNTYDPFIKHLFANNGGDDQNFARVRNACEHLESLGMSFYDLRKDFIAKKLLRVSDCFVQHVEYLLLQPPKLHLDLMINIGPAIAGYFSNFDKVAEGQLQELEKIQATQVRRF